MGPFFVGQVPADPQVFQVDNDDGSPKDLSNYTSISVLMVLPDGTVNTVPGTVLAYDPGFTGRVLLQWSAPSPFVQYGRHEAIVKLMGPGSILDYTSAQTFEVEPAPGTSPIPTATWASVLDVNTITGFAVTNDQIIQAQCIIDNISNRTPSASAQLRQRDLMWLKRAVAYQAVWQKDQPDLFTRFALTQVSQDGINANFQSKVSIYLGPLAERALKNVSWMRSKSLRIRIPLVDGDNSLISPATAAADDLLENWQPIY